MSILSDLYSCGIPFVVESRAPTTGDNGYGGNNPYTIPTLWYDEQNEKVYILSSVSGGTATWEEVNTSHISGVETITIDADGIATITDTGADELHITLKSYSGTIDTLVKLAGFVSSRKQKIYLYAYVGHTITIDNGSYLKMPGNYIISGYKRIVFQYEGDGICVMLSTASNVS